MYVVYLVTVLVESSEIKHTRLAQGTILDPHMPGLAHFDHGVALWWQYRMVEILS